MRYAAFEFECEWHDDFTMPPFPGSMLRGALCMAFRRLVCVIRKQTCEECLLKRQCLYSVTFEPLPPQNKRINLSSTPHPYLIEWSSEISGPHRKGQTFRFSLVLIGDFIRKLPYFVYAVQQMGETGLGRANDRNERKRFSLLNVYCQNEQLYNAQENSLPAEIPSREMTYPPARNCDVETVSRVKIDLETPLRVKHNGRFVSRFDFPVLVQAALRRVRALWSCYAKEDIDIDTNRIMNQARTIQLIRDDTKWTEQIRFSNRQRTKMNMDGVTGSLLFEGNFARLIPLMQMAEPFHIGKSTSFGLGKFRLDRCGKESAQDQPHHMG